MPNIDKAVHLLQPGETAVAVFTDGTYLHINADGSGTSGKWKMDAERTASRVIIYKKNGRGRNRTNEIYLARFHGSKSSDEEGRRTILFSGATLAGVTEEKWTVFSGHGSSNPAQDIKG